MWENLMSRKPQLGFKCTLLTNVVAEWFVLASYRECLKF